jgi:uncharacterized protein YodC (DUF2158 family)
VARGTRHGKLRASSISLEDVDPLNLALLRGAKLHKLAELVERHGLGQVGGARPVERVLVELPLALKNGLQRSDPGALAADADAADVDRVELANELIGGLHRGNLNICRRHVKNRSVNSCAPLNERYGRGMSEQIKPGDVVQLRSGGPRMTVSHRAVTAMSTSPTDWVCVWFAGTERKSDNFNFATLEASKD